MSREEGRGLYKSFKAKEKGAPVFASAMQGERVTGGQIGRLLFLGGV
jgi:hypothetical protein